MRDTIDMAREAGESIDKNWLERFAALVRADERERLAKIQFESLLQAIRIEREACAKVCDEEQAQSYLSVAKTCARLIRARGNT